jgi:small-conductance mechanosensitive channel
VKRELLRRIKVAFDELGIEIPYPHRTIFHRPAEQRGLRAAEIPNDWSRHVA